MVNYNIVENNDSYLNMIYESFKEDFINPNITVKELKDRYDLSTRKYNQLREKVLNETNLENKPYINKGPANMITEDRYIFFNNHGRCSICKTVNGVKKSFGTYKDYETAQEVRDILIQDNWDDDIALELKKEYGAGRYSPSIEQAYEVYDEFEELFLEGIHSKIIQEKLQINQYQYNKLSEKVRSEYGLISKKNTNILKNMEKI